MHNVQTLQDEELSNFLLSMNLEQVPNTGDHIALPQELIECAAGFSAVNVNPVKKLSGAMAELAGISADVQASINEIQDAFDHEKEQVKEFKAIVGKALKPLDQGLSEELNFNKEAHKVAVQTERKKLSEFVHIKKLFKKSPYMHFYVHTYYTRKSYNLEIRI